jgi:GTP-dependent phosphoenolpyruvate carboxykinase
MLIFSFTSLVIVIYTISGIKAILQDSSVKIADDEGVSPSSSVITRVSCNMLSPRVMYKILSKTAPN